MQQGCDLPSAAMLQDASEAIQFGGDYNTEEKELQELLRQCKQQLPQQEVSEQEVIEVSE